MKVFDQLARQRNWPEEERIVLDQVQKVADEIIEPNAARFDETSEFPWESVNALMALGMTRLRVVKLFTLEGGLHSVFALAVGALYGTPLFYLLATRGISLPYGEEAGVVSSGSLYPVFGPQLILSTMLLVAGVVTVVSFIPASKIAKMQPTEALRGKIN